MTSAADLIQLQTFNSRIQAIASEMAENVLRAAHSTFIKETWDIASLLVTPDGEAFACSKDIAAKRLGMSLAPVLELVGHGNAGDVFMSNDPEATGGLATHLPDMFLWTPIYSGDVLLCFALVFVHISDVGGLVPGSISPSASELYQEGVRLPPVKLYRRGVLMDDVRNILLANSRVKDQTWGDISAVVGALKTGSQRISEMLNTFPANRFIELSGEILDFAEARAKQLIAEIPNGSYEFSDYVDGLPSMEPIRISLRLLVEDAEITMDFSGTDSQVRAAYNLYSHSQDGHWGLTRAFTDYFQTVDPEVPWNSGLVRPIRVRAPKGSVLNPDFGAACGARVSTFFRVYYMVFGALSIALPERMPASGAAATGVMLIATRDAETNERRINVGQAVFGGGGARARADGFDGNEMVSWYLRNVSIEILEQEMDVRFLEYGLAPGTAGPGRFRGGLGTTVSLQFLNAESTVTMRGLQRHQFSAWGVAGGAFGSRGQIEINPGKEDQRHLQAIDVLTMGHNDVLKVTTAGGGGHGDPFERSIDAVLGEIASSLLSEDQAALDYGVIVVDGRLDAAATMATRGVARAQRPVIDFGPERLAYEKVWTTELREAIVSLTEAAPRASRESLRAALADSIRDRSGQGQINDHHSLMTAAKAAIGHARLVPARD